MKLSLLVLASAFLSLSATASSYQDWMRSNVKVECKSTFEHQERIIVSTIKTNIVQQGTDNEGVKSLEVYSQVQIKNKEVRRKYVLTSTKVDVLDDNESYETHVFKPMIVSGKHPVTGEKIRIEIEVDKNSDDSNGFRDASLFIGGKEQTYLKLSCSTVFAG
jgi:hypothetical protein